MFEKFRNAKQLIASPMTYRDGARNDPYPFDMLEKYAPESPFVESLMEAKLLYMVALVAIESNGKY